jgi:hypothetical protein
VAGIALASLGKFEELLGDDPVTVIVLKLKRYANHFQRDTQDPLGVGIQIAAI